MRPATTVGAAARQPGDAIGLAEAAADHRHREIAAMREIARLPLEMHHR